MTKVNINISIDYKLKKKAKEKKINISRLLEEALELELNERVYKEAQENICKKCNENIEMGDAELIEVIKGNFAMYHKGCVPDKKTMFKEEINESRTN